MLLISYIEAWMLWQWWVWKGLFEEVTIGCVV